MATSAVVLSNGEYGQNLGRARPAPPQEPTQGDVRRGEELLCQWVQGLFLDAVTARNKAITTSEWREFEQGYWGDYWSEALPTWKSPIQINELKRLILSELSDLTDNAPTFYATASPQTKERDKTVEQAIHAYWQRYFVDLTILEACVDACIWPCAFFEVPWNPLKLQGQGEVELRVRAPQTVFPDPYATDDDDWRYVITQDVMDINEVRQRWPDQGYRVRPDSARPYDPQPQLTPPERPAGVGLITPLYPLSAPVPTQGMDTRVSIYTCRVKDSTLEVVPDVVKDAEGVEHLVRATRYKYPQGRLIQCTSTVVLYDNRMPYGDGFDLLRLNLQPAMHRFWPQRSMLGELLELQRASDKMDSLSVENALRMQKPGWLADANSGIDVRTFGDIPGQVTLIRPGAKVEALRPPAMPGELIQYGSRLRGLMREQVGQMPSRQGQQGRGNVSAELTETEISQAMGLTRLRARYLYKGVHRLVSKLLARMGQFYVYPRVLPFIQHEQWAPVEWEPLRDWRQYAVYLDPNSFTIQSKTLTKRLALMLARMGRMASDEDLYKILEFPDGQGIAQRNKRQLELMAQANAQQKAQGRSRGRK